MIPIEPNRDVAQKERDIFSSNLRFYLLRAGKTQIDLVHDLGVTSSTVSDWANAKKYPRVDKMQAIADYLGILLSDLREIRNTEKPAAETGSELSEDAQRIAMKASLLSEESRKVLEDYIDFLAAKGRQ